MARHYQKVVNNLITDSSQHIWKIPLLSLEEERQQLVEWNCTQATYPRDQCIHQLFEKHNLACMRGRVGAAV